MSANRADDVSTESKMKALERRIAPLDGVGTERFPAPCLPVSQSSTPIPSSSAAGHSSVSASGAPLSGTLMTEGSSNSLPTMGNRSSQSLKGVKRERPPLPDPPSYVKPVQQSTQSGTNSDSNSSSAEITVLTTGAKVEVGQDSAHGGSSKSVRRESSSHGQQTVITDEFLVDSQEGVVEESSKEQHNRGQPHRNSFTSPRHTLSSSRRRTSHFTQDEDKEILAAVEMVGEDWNRVAAEANIRRAPNSIRKRYKALVGSSSSNPGTSVVPANPVTGNVGAPALKSGTHAGGQTGSEPVVVELNSPPLSPRIISTKSSSATGDPQPSSKQCKTGADSGSVQAPSVPKQPKNLTDYFKSPDPPPAKVQKMSLTSSTSAVAESRAKTDDVVIVGSETASEKIESLKAELARTKDMMDALNSELEEMKEQSWRQRALNTKYRETLIRVLKENAMRKRMEAMERVARECVSIGHVQPTHQGLEIVEVWKPGMDYKRAAIRLKEIRAFREELESKRPKKKKGGSSSEPAAAAAAAAAASSSASSSPMKDGGSGLSGFSLLGREEPDMSQIVQLKIAALKKEEAEIQEEMTNISAQRMTLIREMKRVADEENSVRNGFDLLVDRYLLLNLLGKGGFSEVYSAFDLLECREVACKFHTLNPVWDEDRKRTYIRHACREYNIHRQLNHPKVVRLYDVFEINNDCFCTVLEMCSGGDLDSYIKQQVSLSEKEARCIITQIFSGLVYLNSLKNPIIHYDLKPANILFSREGEVKISDFGLSKIMDRGSDSMELTSQGAGTYWYLPPECFETGMTVPKISTKVDVWSAGIIYYQMLYGKKPFGNNLSQEKFRMNNVARNAVLEFPPKPAVSAETKEFIRRCLHPQVAVRPDARTCYADLIKK